MAVLRLSMSALVLLLASCVFAGDVGSVPDIIADTVEDLENKEPIVDGASGAIGGFSSDGVTIVGCGKPCGIGIGICQKNKICIPIALGGAPVCTKPLMKVGEKCTDPCWNCELGLECVPSVGKQKVCAKPLPKVGCLRPCGPGIANCKDTLECLSLYPGAAPVCTKPLMKEGERCTDPCWNCEPGLDCVPSGKQKFCVAPKH